MRHARRRVSKKASVVILVAVGVLAAAAVAVLLVPTSARASRAPTWSVTAALVVANLPVTPCPTHLGAPSSRTGRLPTHVAAAVERSEAATLSAFTDAQGTVQVVAPSTWQCTALDGIAGSSTLVVYPPGQSRPAWGDVTNVRRGIVASQTGQCSGCSLETACALFPAAAQQYHATYGVDCQGRPAAGELLSRESPSKARFVDPIGVAGSGRPSGGGLVAYGAMDWREPVPHDTTAWRITCTLPDDDRTLCVLTVEAFLARLPG